LRRLKAKRWNVRGNSLDAELKPRDLNNIVKQDHQNIKRIVRPMIGGKSLNSARRTLSGIEAMNRIRKGK
jgi:transposase-like protein